MNPRAPEFVPEPAGFVLPGCPPGGAIRRGAGGAFCHRLSVRWGMYRFTA